uniref:L-2-hydroxyglutarate dehydrogenase, mitochondrial n=2 Tax=Lygus hesperus TaxID=30085 RepID=A0A0A9YP20_LYGHE
MSSSIISLRCRCSRPRLTRWMSSFSTKQITDQCFDIAVVGGGIVGIAAAREILTRNPQLSCAVIEKEPELARHQSGNNSGVIHAGIYYAPGSMRALLCQKGMNLAYEYLDKRKIPYKKVGKLIVATHTDELPRLATLYDRGLKNNVKDLCIVESRDISDIEPHCVGIRALHSPHTGIVDWGLVTKCFAEDFHEIGGTTLLNFEVKTISNGLVSSRNIDIARYPVTLTSKDDKEVHAGYVLCCAGLFADRVAVMSGGTREPAILPVRGEFLELVEHKRHLVKGNIYPVPDPKFPFLGVHFTPRMDGRVLLGPNAVLAFKREGYKYSDVSISDCWEYLMYPGFRKLALNNAKFGFQEFSKSVFLSLQLEKLKAFIPEITVHDIKRGPSGVRAQALSPKGDLVEDFVFEGGIEQNSRVLHCRNAPSPAATSSMAIAQVLADKMFQLIG